MFAVLSVLKNKFSCLLILCISVSTAYTHAQQLFNTEQLHEIRIEIAQNNWYDTLQVWYIAALNGADKQYLPSSITIDGKTLEKNSGIRFKGNYSNYGFPGVKKPFRIHFNKFSDKQNVEGIKKINLHNFAGDPSFMREYISYDLFRFCGISASRTSFTKLFINNEYWGCYLIVEEPEDKLFLKQNFGSNEGNLFDNSDDTRLEWKGNDPASYPDLKLQTKEKDSSWTKLLNWMQLFNTYHNYDLAQQLNTLFDIDGYMKTLALDVYLNNWDSYPYDGRNFFIYDNPVSGKLHWVPWDYNLAMWQKDLALFPRDADTQYTYKPLIARFVENDFLRETYYQNFCSLLNNELKDYPAGNKTTSVYNLIKDAVATDSLKFYTTDDFHKNISETVVVNMLRNNVQTDVTLPGITALLAARKVALTNELKASGCDCSTIKNDGTSGAWHIKVFPNPAINELSVYIEEATDTNQTIQTTFYTADGKKVKQTTTSMHLGTAVIDISDLPSSIYILRLAYQNNTRIIKIVKG